METVRQINVRVNQLTSGLFVPLLTCHKAVAEEKQNLVPFYVG